MICFLFFFCRRHFFEAPTLTEEKIIVSQMSTTCGFKGCLNHTYLVMPVCTHCGKRMCTAHLLPEVHGCGDAVKNASQRQATADAAEMRRRRKHLGLDDVKARLDRRREELATQRKKKSSKGKQ
ncbi:hypothetical protein TcCL_NonESM02644 [Trypanosoma cruzi]|nr:hypothetical protein TcCL_NonESM02644 [Trypanosoma cruzi]